MINQSFFYNNTATDNPYVTLALEEAMMMNLAPSQIILYLYTHSNAVIIGKNQNAWKECRFSRLNADDGILARRISGGGAVYHDSNNLNFSFIVNSGDYDVTRQLSVIARAVSMFGINAEVSGRNDILVNEKKFSGNAFCFKKDKAFHHGTILIDVNADKMSEYLSVSPDKISSKGIESVRSRVCNLKTLNPEITVSSMAEALRNAFDIEYGSSSDYVITDKIKFEAEKAEERNRSWDWVFGYQGAFDITKRKRFSWGDAEICLNLYDAVIEKAIIFSDAMDADYIDKLSQLLPGHRLESAEIRKILSESAETDEQHLISCNISEMLAE